MEIDRDAPAVGSSEIEIAAPPEVVWDVLADFGRWPDWNSEVKSMSVSEPAAPGAEFKWKSGPATITSTVQSADRPELLTWTGSATGTQAIHTWHFEGQGGTTHVRTEESMDGWLVGSCAAGFRRSSRPGSRTASPI